MGKESLNKRAMKASLSQSMIFHWQIALHTTSHTALYISGSRQEAVCSLRKSHIQKHCCANMRLLGQSRSQSNNSVNEMPPLARAQLRRRHRK